MGGTVTTDILLIDNCDSDLASWTIGGGIGSQETEAMIEGTGCIGMKVNATTQVAYRTITAITDMSGKLFYIWIMGLKVSQFDTQANGGIAIRLGTNTTNYRTWYIGGNNKYRGGWECYCIDPTQSGSIADVGTYNVNSITYVAVSFKTITASTKANCFFDYLHYGTGLGIYGGTSGSPATFADFITQEATSKYGVIYKSEGILFVQGILKFGSLTQASNTYFKDTSQVIAYIDRIVASNYYEIVLQGKSGQTTEVYFGTKSGSAGISGCVFDAAGTAKYKVTATNADLTMFGFYGCSFINADVISLPANNQYKEVLNCNFVGCAEVSSSTTTMTNCNFISSSGMAVTFSTYLTYCNFINCAIGVEITASQTFVGLIFTTCTYDVKKTNAGAATITNTFNSNAGTYDPAGAVVTFVTSVTLTLDGLIANSEVEIVTHGTTTEEAHVENSGTSFAYPYNWTANHYVDIFITKNDYVWFVMWNYLLLNANTTVPISQQKDRVYANP